MNKNNSYFTNRKLALLKEKQRNNLELIINQKEAKLLKTNIPIQKIIGFVCMQNLQLKINKKVLIPRYETEELILQAYKYINGQSTVLDLGCGSGFIGLAIAKNTKAKQVVLSDIDSQAILQSKINAKLNKLKVKIIQSDLFDNLKKYKFDVIICNPPYLDFEKSKLDSSVLDYEPWNALFAKQKGNYFYQKILKQYKSFLKPKGVILFEIDQTNLEFFNKYYPEFKLIYDINNKVRIAVYESE
ncbi:peptide chain release factor N(5)-glutamine methyltransferase [Mesomycoplasma hyorhinis]|uniref:peptide chain release factor N(5)-glutamine methyltransferase n=3 Tax=Mesomycoplasma hyorhinis TaxID=2100 RepID=A0ABD6IDF2_MESHY|nr:peptide chain release factor N(5)-glutamine methyltransferase [Mesomycoplasma hyorhinis]AEC45627.1 N5-glutamine S-adenosyl-L-methionine-dependent methyltransferase [Mesomycoplasma hyorhinis MCLD]AEX14040.1 methyltransferase, HemK family [Mesomycoplasma hyorhinis GDL-1]AFX74284.1 Protein-N(5)-glutamine methyltransferase PrmC [Mesomycoplasma hyorhinis SK76]AHA41030.1 protein-(glutamine-N5) methyltransferase, release factor-specific [Mesomycoplasma hyorhinis DBS 1050]AOD25266.1 methyltransfera